MLSPRLSVTDTVCLHFCFSISRPGMGGIRRQSIKKPNFWNSEPTGARSMLAMVALCSGDFKIYSDTSRHHATSISHRATTAWMSVCLVSFYFFLFICGRAKCLSYEQCVGSSARADALCSSCSLPTYLERWAALYEAGRSVLVLMKVSKIPSIELNTLHLYQHYSLFMHNKLLYTWRGDYCECVRPAQIPVLTEVRAPSLLEQYPRYVPHRDRAGYNIGTNNGKWIPFSIEANATCI